MRVNGQRHARRRFTPGEMIANTFGKQLFIYVGYKLYVSDHYHRPHFRPLPPKFQQVLEDQDGE
jgi:hypothetical protein